MPATVLALLSSVAFSILSASPAAAAHAPDELTALRAALQHTRKLTAHFKQTRHWAALQDPLVTEGTFEYQKGGRLVWHTLPPAESELVLEGNSAVMRYPALNTSQAVDFSSDPGMGKAFESIRAVLQADLGALDPLFSVKVEKKAPLQLLLVPKSAELEKMLEGIQLRFDKEYRLLEVHLSEGNGDWTEIQFSHQVVVQT